MFLFLTQLLVSILLLALFLFFAVLPLDSDDAAAVAPPPPSTSSNVFFLDDIQQIDLPHLDSSPSLPTTTTQQHQSGENLIIKGEIEIARNGSMRREEIMEEEEASSLYVHPCHYFQLASVAFLKCFGLDSTSDGPSTRKHRKRKES